MCGWVDLWENSKCDYIQKYTRRTRLKWYKKVELNCFELIVYVFSKKNNAQDVNIYVFNIIFEKKNEIKPLVVLNFNAFEIGMTMRLIFIMLIKEKENNRRIYEPADWKLFR